MVLRRCLCLVILGLGLLPAAVCSGAGNGGIPGDLHLARFSFSLLPLTVFDNPLLVRPPARLALTIRFLAADGETTVAVPATMLQEIQDSVEQWVRAIRQEFHRELERISHYFTQAEKYEDEQLSASARQTALEQLNRFYRQKVLEPLGSGIQNAVLQPARRFQRRYRLPKGRIQIIPEVDGTILPASGTLHLQDFLGIPEFYAPPATMSRLIGFQREEGNGTATCSWRMQIPLLPATCLFFRLPQEQLVADWHGSLEELAAAAPRLAKVSRVDIPRFLTQRNTHLYHLMNHYQKRISLELLAVKPDPLRGIEHYFAALASTYSNARTSLHHSLKDMAPPPIAENGSMTMRIRSIGEELGATLLRPGWKFSLEELTTADHQAALAKVTTRFLRRGPQLTRSRDRFWRRFLGDLARLGRTLERDQPQRFNTFARRMLQSLEDHEFAVRRDLGQQDRLFLLLQQAMLNESGNDTREQERIRAGIVSLISASATELGRISLAHHGLSSLWLRRRSPQAAQTLIAAWQKLLSPDPTP